MTVLTSRLVSATCILGYLLAAEGVRAQWNLQSAIPTNRGLAGVTFATKNHIFACGGNHHLLESTNAGQTWVTRMSGDYNTDAFYTVLFSDSLHGYMTGNNQDAWRTTNGGATWLPMSSVPGGSWYHLDFIGPMTGFAGANGACVFTSDGGVTWILKSGYPECPIMFGMDFRDEQVGLAGGILQGNDGIFKTSNGGSTWISKLSLSANDVIWMNNSQAIATVGTSIYRSTDAGETWSEIAGGITTGLGDLERVSTETAVGVSYKGDIWRTTNGGVSWTQVVRGLGDLPDSWAVSFYDSLHGAVVGEGGLIYASNDGGVTWRMLNSGVGVQIYDLEMFSNTFGLVAGINGFLFRTTNGGSRWEVQKLEVTGQIFGRDEGLHAVNIVDTGFAVTAGPGGTVFRTYDGGQSWQSIGYPVLPGDFLIEDVKFVDRLNGWVVGLDQDLGHDHTIYKTTDGGTTWSSGPLMGGYMFSVDFADLQHGWIATAGSGYIRTTDGGVSWLSETLSARSISKMRFIDQNNGWAVGWDGFVAQTVNGGTSWTIKDIGTSPDNLFGLSVISANEVWMTGRDNATLSAGVVYHTTDAGVNWSREVISSYPEIPYTISARPSGDVWVGAYGGRIWRKNGIATSAGTPASRPDVFLLAQNYPNPFNPATMIQYELADAGEVSLKVFDLLGREVATLVNEVKSAGSYSVRWDATTVGSGTYFARLESNGKRQIKKMLLIR